MNATTYQLSSRHPASRSRRRIRLGLSLGTGILACAGIVFVGSLSRSEPPAAAESLFTEAVQPSVARLKSAREAEKRGEHELAIHDYLASIQEDRSTAEAAIGEMVTVFLSVARRMVLTAATWINLPKSTGAIRLLLN